MMVALTPDQLRALVRACRDQSVFHVHAAEQEEATGYHEYAADDMQRAANLTALADQLEDLLCPSVKRFQLEGGPGHGLGIQGADPRGA